MTDFAVSDGHVLHLEETGSRGGLPAVFLHGGPGSGCQPDQATLFDPARWRVVLFDQRGAGRSRPRRSLVANTTQHLIADIEAIRIALAIDRWVVVGGSWGATLALAYAQAHPERVMALALRGVFLGTAPEARWAFERAAQIFRPELWRRFVDLLPAAERSSPIAAYTQRLLDPDAAIYAPAAHAWNAYERALSLLTPSGPALPVALDPSAVPPGDPPNSPIIEAHYMRHDFFLAPRQLLMNAARLRSIPGIIVQGRYDLLCPPETAHALASAWPDAKLHLIEGAGHSAAEPATRQALIEAIAEIERRAAR